MYLLPYPSSKYLPKLMVDNQDEGIIALCEKMDSDLLAFRDLIIGLFYIKDPARMPSTLLSVMADMIGVTFYRYDTEQTKRAKLYAAVASHKLRGLWEAQVKIIFDSIAGYDAQLINTPSYKKAANLWVECDGVVNVGTHWAPEGVGVVAGYLGFEEITPGGSYTLGIPGSIWIDCHHGVVGPVLTAETLSQLVLFLTQDAIPAYMQGYLAYYDASGLVQVYPGGIIN
jgi:hypothetical protein